MAKYNGTGIKAVFFLFLLISASCSKKVTPDPESLKPAWLKAEPIDAGYYTGVGRASKLSDNNYIQTARKSALDDLVTQIKVNVTSSSILSVLEQNKKLTSEEYQQRIQTNAAEEIEEFEQVDAWEDASTYWVYYRLSISRYKAIQAEKKRNAVQTATDFYSRAVAADKEGNRVQSLGYYFQALNSLERYLDEAIKITFDGKEILLANSIYGAIQGHLDNIVIRVTPDNLSLNRRLVSGQHEILAHVSYRDSGLPATGMLLKAGFKKGSGEVFPEYVADANGNAKILMSKIGARDLEQTILVEANTNAFSGSQSKLLELIIASFKSPQAQILLNVKRPVVLLTNTERVLGNDRKQAELGNRLRSLLAAQGFEFTTNPGEADLTMEIQSDTEQGSVSGSIYITYLTCTIKVTATGGREIYTASMERIRGYGLDYQRSSLDGYTKATETLEKEKIQELVNNILE